MPKNIVSVFMGWLLAMAVLLIMWVIAAILLAATNLQESWVLSSIPYVRAVCVAIGAFFAAKTNGHQGLWQGLGVSAICLAILLLGRTNLAIASVHLLLDIILLLLAGIIGGLMGVMLK